MYKGTDMTFKCDVAGKQMANEKKNYLGKEMALSSLTDLIIATK